MLKSVEKRCNDCNRVLHRSYVEIDGEEWEIKEQYETVDTFRARCWPCSCNKAELSFDGESPKSRHTAIIDFLVDKGCGC